MESDKSQKTLNQGIVLATFLSGLAFLSGYVSHLVMPRSASSNELHLIAEAFGVTKVASADYTNTDCYSGNVGGGGCGYGGGDGGGDSGGDGPGSDGGSMGGGSGDSDCDCGW